MACGALSNRRLPVLSRKQSSLIQPNRSPNSVKLNARTLEKALPLLAVENNCLISKLADVTVGFRLLLPEIFTQSPEDYRSLHSALCKAIKMLPVGTVIHKQDWFMEEKYQADQEHDDTSFLTLAFQRHFIERPFLNHYCYLYISKLPKSRQKQKSTRHSLTRRRLVPREQVDPKELQSFFDAVSQFERILQDGGIAAERLTDDDFVSGKGDRGIVPNYFRLQPDGRRKVTLEDWDIDGHVRIGDKEVMCFTLSDVEALPHMVDVMAGYGPLSSDSTQFAVGNVLPVGLMLPCNHMYNQYICIEDGPAALREFEQQTRYLNSLSMYSNENAINRDWTQKFIQEAITAQRTVCRSHFNLMVWTEKPEQIDYLRSRASAAIAQLDCLPKHNTQDAARLLWAGIPGNAGDLPLDDTFYTFVEQAVCMFNLESSYRSSLSPFGIRLCDRFGKPVWVDLSDEPMERGWITNRNKFIIGPSGSGKSFFTNHMVRQYYEQGTHVLLVDVGHSYRGLCEMIHRKTRGRDGVYLTYEEDNPITFNPFYAEDGVFGIEKKESIKTLLLTLWKKETEQFTRTEEVALSDAVEQYLKLIKKTPGKGSFNGFYEYCDDENGFRAYLTEKKYEKDYFDVQKFLLTMQPFYKGGEYDYLLNSDLKIDLLNKRFVVFELDNIKDHPILYPVVTLIIMETFVAKMRRLKGVRKMMLIEEAWKAIAKEGMATYIQYLFKTVRKYFGEAVIVTQEIDDIIGNQIVKDAVINNSDCKILLDQSKYQNRFDEVRQLLGLTEKQKQLVLSVNKDLDPMRKYKEVFIALGHRSKVYATEVSLEEYAAYTTEETEKYEVQQRTVANGGDIQVAIVDFADSRRAKASV
ncbi:TraG family conjugative transposon ATPase [Larkinella punicea]|uniref:TraG family conjugative transposon ATPase n=1 Tax=Larkinella punicea TaxID=2315727 RepID=A0A368JKI4_9BACT|nr:TraG family conjugative transposon ATPase [Larkinella punicea]